MPYVAGLPVSFSPESNLRRYLNEINQFPILSMEEEYNLAKSWKEEGNVDSARKLVTSHLRLVARIALKYRGYGLPVSELISEGNVGMMQAVRKFEPDKGFRLSTYAMWWIRASIQEYVLRSWSLVRIGTTAAKKKLFFNLRRIKNKMQLFDDNQLSQESLKGIADELDVSVKDVEDVDKRMRGGDYSLNQTIGEEDGGEWQDLLQDETPKQDEHMIKAQSAQHRAAWLGQALKGLNEREREIVLKRHLSDNPVTLQNLSEDYAVSRERIRQIETRAIKKLTQSVIALSEGASS